jgi:TonB family protein
VAPRVGKLIERIEPTFPRNTLSDRGFVRARLTVDGKGAVTGVDILERTDSAFERAVRNAVTQWKYEATGSTFTAMAEIVFQR